MFISLGGFQEFGDGTRQRADGRGSPTWATHKKENAAAMAKAVIGQSRRERLYRPELLWPALGGRCPPKRTFGYGVTV
jgi:hypothetical protein